MSEQRIEQLFKDALGNLEADVRPEIWSGIEQGLQAPAGASHGGFSAGKSAGILGKVGLKGLLMISATTVTVVGTIIYFSATKPAATAPASRPVEVTHQAPESQAANSVVSGNPKTVADPVSAPASRLSATSQKQKNESVASAATAQKNIAQQNKPGGASAEPAIAVNSPATSAGLSSPTSSGNGSSAVSGHTAPLPTAGSMHAAQQPNVSRNPVIQSEASSDPIENAEITGQKAPVFDTIEKYIVSENGTPGLITIFTPDGDGYNDQFRINTRGLKSMEVIIFDQSGRKIYSWKSLNGQWDGKLPNGNEAPSGYYYYSVNAETLDGKICIGQSTLRLSR